MRRIVLCVAGVLVALAPAAFAGGMAPTYVTSDPQDGATVDSAPSRVSVTFSEPLDAGSTLQVFDQCGQAVDSGDEQVLGSRIDVGIAKTPAGHYTAVYLARGFGGATGETKGSFSFHVTSGEPCGGGHDGHGGHGGPGGGGGGGHDGHGGGGDGKGHRGHGSDGGHSDHGGFGGPDHSGSGGTHTGHGSGGGDHGDGGGHGDGQDGHGKQGHHDGRGNGKHSGTHQGESSTGGGLSELASGRGGPGLAPTSTSVVIALTLSVVMGALGGWVLRVSAGS